MKFNGWIRLLIVLSGIWIAIVAMMVEIDRLRVLDDAIPWGLVELRDTKTGKTFGSLRKSEILRLGELTLKKSKSSDAEPGDFEEANLLIKSEPVPALADARITALILVPLTIIWSLYGCILWVRAGFVRNT